MNDLQIESSAFSLASRIIDYLRRQLQAPLHHQLPISFTINSRKSLNHWHSPTTRLGKPQCTSPNSPTTKSTH